MDIIMPKQAVTFTPLNSKTNLAKQVKLLDAGENCDVMITFSHKEFLPICCFKESKITAQEVSCLFEGKSTFIPFRSLICQLAQNPTICASKLIYLN